MADTRTPVAVEEAVARVMAFEHTGRLETVDIQHSDGRYLAEDIIAADPVPAFDKSPYDGFAFYADDTSGASPDAPVKLEVTEVLGAGELSASALASGQAKRIMTGAQIPEGANCVEMFERCSTYDADGTTYMMIDHEVAEGDNVVKASSEMNRGDVLISKGTPVNPGVKAILATFGYKQVPVAQKPVVGVIATGTELLDVDEPLEPGKIRNSNAHMIMSQINRAGGDYIYYGKLPDELEPSMKIINQALDEVDVLVTTGGVSVGDFDLMPAIYQELGADVLFNKVAMRPGSVTTVAVKDGKMLYGLSGNPSACYVGFELFARPVIGSRLFSRGPYHKRVKAVLAEDFPKPNPFTRFVRSYISYDKEVITVHLAGIDKSNIVSSLPFTTALMVLPGGTKGFKAGDRTDVLLLDQQTDDNQFESF